MRHVQATMRTSLAILVAAYCAGGLTLAGCSDDTGGGGAESEAGLDGPSELDGTRLDGRAVDAAEASVNQDSATADAPMEGGPDVVSEVDASDAGDSGDSMVVADGSGAEGSTTIDASDASDAAHVDASDASDAAHIDASDASDAAHEDAASDASDATVISTDASDSSVEFDASDAADSTMMADASDASDAADAHDAIVLPPGLTEYAGNYAQAYCQGLYGCCTGVDMDACAAQNGATSSGWEGTLPGSPEVCSRGNLTFDQDAAARCITALKSFPCSSDGGGDISAASYSAITEACQDVLGGTIASGAAGCINSYECVQGTYCDTASGVCTPLVGDGGVCITNDMCSSPVSGVPTLFCNNVLPGLADGGLASGVCVPLLVNGADCLNAAGNNAFNYACSSLLCGTPDFVTWTCGVDYAFQTTCP